MTEHLFQISAVIRARDADYAMRSLESQLGGINEFIDYDLEPSVLSLDVARKQTETYNPGIRIEKVISNA